MFSTKIEPIFIIDLTLCSNCQIYGEDFVNFCGLGKNYEINSSIVKSDKVDMTFFKN